jgi:dephospho-CoA kinase
MTEAKLRHIRQLQVPDHIKRQKADHIIETGTSRIETRAAIRRLIACLRARKRR